MTRRVAVVTGGGGGIGAAIAEELGRTGDHVVTMDPVVSLDGTERIREAGETTADRIVAAGGSARSSSVSVTDAPGVRELFEGLVAELGRLDIVVNVAGISRPTGFARGTEVDWRDVLEVHLDGYRNVLAAALPIMEAAGRGWVLGVTSGSGWRAADAGAYSCAKRAVASLTWELGPVAPDGVVVNALSPIAATRMVTAALRRAGGGGGGGAASSRGGAASSGGGATASRASGGLSLGTMPEADRLGPVGAYLVSDDVRWCRGQVLFSSGAEVAVIGPPRPLEVVGADDAGQLREVVAGATTAVLVPAEAAQASTGGGNPRLGSVGGDTGDAGDVAEPGAGDGLAGGAGDAVGSGAGDGAPTNAAGRVGTDTVVRSCAVVHDDPERAAPVLAALRARGVRCHEVPAADVGDGVAGAAQALQEAGEELTAGAPGGGPADGGSPDSGMVPDAVVVVGGSEASPSVAGWRAVLAGHDDLAGTLRDDARWARAVADASAESGRSMRLAFVLDALSPGGRSRAQAVTQLCRSAEPATDRRVAAFVVGVESPPSVDGSPVGELVAHLVCGADTAGLSGAELAAGDGWIELRSHPHPTSSITFGGPEVPVWLDGRLRDLVRAAGSRARAVGSAGRAAGSAGPA